MCIDFDAEFSDSICGIDEMRQTASKRNANIRTIQSQIYTNWQQMFSNKCIYRNQQEEER